MKKAELTGIFRLDLHQVDYLQFAIYYGELPRFSRDTLRALIND